MVQELLTVDTGNAIAHCVAFDRATKVLAVGCSNAEIKMINVVNLCWPSILLFRPDHSDFVPEPAHTCLDSLQPH